jgi:two-component sensor histidine kinase
MTVSDNGVGMPPHLNMQGAETLGLQLVETLVEQIDGVRETVSGGGTTHHIVFRNK